jgi:putative membrane protein
MMSDPRVFFAAERTLLAWLRTGLAVIGLGFVVARFGLFLRIIAQAPSPISNSWSLIIGVGLVLLGAIMTGGAAWQHALFCRELAPFERPARYWAGFALLVTALVSGCGLALAVYLVMSAGQA